MPRDDEGHTSRHVVVPYNATNASVRARLVHWVDRLVDAGHLDRRSVTIHGPGFDGPRLPSHTDRLLLVRNARKLTRGGVERRMLGQAELGVYDLDDGLPWDNGALPGLGRWWKRPFPRSLVAERAAAAADRVIVGNDALAEWAHAWCRDVRVIPTCVEPSDYRQRTNWTLDVQPVIGWIGSPATEHYLVDIADALRRVHRRTGARLHIVSGGASVPAELVEFATASPWAPGAEPAIAAWDVGIMPLRDGVYERAKCGYKLLQYAASGVPAVASPVGVNARLLDAMDGVAATTIDEWVEALESVLTEPAERRASRAARGIDVAAAHSYATWQNEWIDAVGW